MGAAPSRRTPRGSTGAVGWQTLRVCGCSMRFCLSLRCPAPESFPEGQLSLCRVLGHNPSLRAGWGKKGFGLGPVLLSKGSFSAAGCVSMPVGNQLPAEEVWEACR